MSDNKEVKDLIKQLNDDLHNMYKDLDYRLDNVEKVMIAQEINLKEHMRRSDALEAQVSIIKDKELKPINKHIAMVEGAIKLVGLVSIGITIVLGIIKLLSNGI